MGHPKKGHGVLRKKSQVKYTFIKAHRGLFRVRVMCRVLPLLRLAAFAIE
ncbi:hypothetical protein [Kordiimonas sp.]